MCMERSEKKMSEIVSCLFVKWEKGELKQERVLTLKSQLEEVRKEYRGWTEATTTGRKCPKCGSDLMDYGLVNSTDGIIQVFRCRSGKCDHAEMNIKYTPEQVEKLRLLYAPTKHCGKIMQDNWKYCPYCGEQL